MVTDMVCEGLRVDDSGLFSCCVCLRCSFSLKRAFKAPSWLLRTVCPPYRKASLWLPAKSWPAGTAHAGPRQNISPCTILQKHILGAGPLYFAIAEINENISWSYRLSLVCFDAAFILIPWSCYPQTWINLRNEYFAIHSVGILLNCFKWPAFFFISPDHESHSTRMC